MLTLMHIHVHERAAGPKIHVEIGPGLNVPAARYVRLNDALLGGHQLFGRTGRAGRRSDIRHRQVRESDAHDEQQVQVPGTRLVSAHRMPAISRRAVDVGTDALGCLRRWAARIRAASSGRWNGVPRQSSAPASRAATRESRLWVGRRTRIDIPGAALRIARHVVTGSSVATSTSSALKTPRKRIGRSSSLTASTSCPSRASKRTSSGSGRR
jgi:hypothetical protein